MRLRYVDFASLLIQQNLLGVILETINQQLENLVLKVASSKGAILDAIIIESAAGSSK